MEPIRRSQRFASEAGATTFEALGAQARETITELPIIAAYRMISLSNASGKELDYWDASQRIKDAGLQGELEAPRLYAPTEQTLDILIERKKDEIKRRQVMSSAPGDLITKTGMFGTAFLTSMLDPVNIGISFVPVARELKWAQRASKSASAMTRASGRLAIGAVEGAAGAAIIEPLIYASKSLEQADYDLMDSFLNVTFGAAFGAGLHTGFGGVGDVWRGFKGIEQPWVKAEREAKMPEILKRAREKGLDPDDIDSIANDIMASVKNDPDYRVKRSDPEKTAEILTPQEAEEVYRVAVGQLMDGKDVDVDLLLAHFDEPVGPDLKVKDLAAEKFNIAATPDDIAKLMRQEVNRLNHKVGMPDPRRLERIVVDRVGALDKIRSDLEAGKELTPQQKETIRQAKVAQAIEEGAPVPDRFMKGNEPLLKSAQQNRGKYIEKQVKAYRAKPKAPEAKEPEIAKAPDNEIEAAADIEQEIAELEKLNNNIAEKLGYKTDDADMKEANELMVKAERWSAIAETAQLCVMRGG